MRVADRGHIELVVVRRQVYIVGVRRHRAIMHIRTPLDLGLAIRDRRRKLKLSQNQLARKAGVGRQWVVAIEQGKSRAELSLILRTLAALDLPLTIDRAPRRLSSSDDMDPVDIDVIVNAAKEDRT